jgi:PRC-barrel domain
MARSALGYLPRQNPCAQCAEPIAAPDWVESSPGRTVGGLTQLPEPVSGAGSRNPFTILALAFHQPAKGGVMVPDVMTRPHPLVASDRIEGTAVRRPNGDMIGHIERLMIDKVTGKVSYAVLSFGGFLGMGSNLLPLPWPRLRYNTRFEAYELDIDEYELKHAPSFRADKDFDWGDRSQEAALHRYYGIPPYWGGF